MARSIKLKNDTYIDASGIKMHGNFKPMTLSDFIASSRKSWYLTERGWYRIAEVFMWFSTNFAYKPGCILVNLGVDYSWFNGADYLLSICKGGSTRSINVLNKACGYDCIDQVRIVTKDNKNYLDIHWQAANVDDPTKADNFSYNILSFNGDVKILDPYLVDDSGTIQVVKSLL